MPFCGCRYLCTQILKYSGTYLWEYQTGFPEPQMRMAKPPLYFPVSGSMMSYYMPTLYRRAQPFPG